MDSSERETVIYKPTYGVVTIDFYKLPPLIYIKGGISIIKDATSLSGMRGVGKQRKWMAAAIILGQPFA